MQNSKKSEISMVSFWHQNDRMKKNPSGSFGEKETADTLDAYANESKLGQYNFWNCCFLVIFSVDGKQFCFLLMEDRFSCHLFVLLLCGIS